MAIKAIIGLGNPGDKYIKTRHNAGFWLIDDLARTAGVTLKPEKKAGGDVAQTSLGYNTIRLFKPATYMNESGQAIRRLLDFYKLTADEMLVVHDELDLPPGTNRLKQGGGHGGHNGLRDIMSHCGRDFLRLRIGIGHPGEKSQVTGYVLRNPGSKERDLIEGSLPDTGRAVETLLKDGLEKAMLQLHTDSK
ncbi:MAG: aminoacyl-tRNA hydrolase [Gammaproteobacteria bacterium]